MSFKEKIQQELKEAVKNKDEGKTSTMKMLLAALVNEEIRLKKKDEGLNDEESKKIVKSEIKKRQDATEAYEKGKRPELAEKEKKEYEILKKYLPQEMNREEIAKIAEETIKKIGGGPENDFGKIMKAVMAKTKGRADGKIVSEIIKQFLEQ